MDEKYKRSSHKIIRQDNLEKVAVVNEKSAPHDQQVSTKLFQDHQL